MARYTTPPNDTSFLITRRQKHSLYNIYNMSVLGGVCVRLFEGICVCVCLSVRWTGVMVCASYNIRARGGWTWSTYYNIFVLGSDGSRSCSCHHFSRGGPIADDHLTRRSRPIEINRRPWLTGGINSNTILQWRQKRRNVENQDHACIY